MHLGREKHSLSVCVLKLARHFYIACADITKRRVHFLHTAETVEIVNEHGDVDAFDVPLKSETPERLCLC